MLNWVNETLENLDKKLSRTSVEYKDFIPCSVDENGNFTTRYTNDPTWWTNGFWGALMWLMYKQTGKQCYLDTAKSNEVLMDKAFEVYDGLQHDVGFLWGRTSVDSYLMTGDENSKKRFLYATHILASRYNIDAGFITAWNPIEKKNLAIIDTMMNLELLYRVAEITGLDRYKRIAMAHADKTMNYHVRPDGSSNHMVVYDLETGDVIETRAGQGSHVGSSWSRGQGWAIYGFALSYKYTEKQEYLDTAKRVAHYFIANVSKTGYVPKTDFRSPDEPDLRDTSAAMVAAAGMLEIAKHVSEHDKDLYVDNAYKILKATADKYADWSDDYDGIIKNGMHSYTKNEPVHLIYGDYYFADALYKLKEYLEK